MGSCLKKYVSYRKKYRNDDIMLIVDKLPVSAEGRVEHHKLNQVVAACCYLVEFLVFT